MSKSSDQKSPLASLNKGLIRTVKYGGIDTLKRKIRNGADVNHCNKGHQSLLIIALACGKVETATYLLSHEKCDVNIADIEGTTALHFALNDNIPSEVMDLIIICGADLEATNKKGYTPLSGAASDLSKTDKLIRAGANIFKKPNCSSKITGPLLNKYFLFFTAMSKRILNSNAQDVDGLTALFEDETENFEFRHTEGFLDYLRTLKISAFEKQIIMTLCAVPISLKTTINVPLDEDGNRLSHKLIDRGNWDLYCNLCEKGGLETHHKNNKGISADDMFNLGFNTVERIASMVPYPNHEIEVSLNILSYLDVKDMCNLAFAIPPSVVKLRSSSRLIAEGKEARR